jgi:isocitrate/isopropylmalate dehydrogenase
MTLELLGYKNAAKAILCAIQTVLTDARCTHDGGSTA